MKEKKKISWVRSGSNPKIIVVFPDKHQKFVFTGKPSTLAKMIDVLREGIKLEIAGY